MESREWVTARFALIKPDGSTEPEFVADAYAVMATPVLNRRVYVEVVNVDGAPADLSEGQYRATLPGEGRPLVVEYKSGMWRTPKASESGEKEQLRCVNRSCCESLESRASIFELSENVAPSTEYRASRPN